MKFKAGDRVKCVRGLCYNGVAHGDTGTVLDPCAKVTPLGPIVRWQNDRNGCRVSSGEKNLEPLVSDYEAGSWEEVERLTGWSPRREHERCS